MQTYYRHITNTHPVAVIKIIMYNHHITNIKVRCLKGKKYANAATFPKLIMQTSLNEVITCVA